MSYRGNKVRVTDRQTDRQTDFIHTNYPNHLHIFTDGSKLENNQAGAAFYIPKLNISRSFHVGLNYSNYTAELIGIEQGLLYICL